MSLKNIRNFSIIAHIDHGKSTLADRMLEVTKTIEARKMKDQVLDRMDLERERGITIKMQPVRMEYRHDDTAYVLNLIDTPGHVDFAYEVSRALKAVEGAVLLVDSTQGVQAQTLTTLSMAKEAGLVIIPAISKVDSKLARPKEIKEEVAEVLDCLPEDVLEVSGKTGQGVEELLQEVIAKIPEPRVKEDTNDLQALVFDFEYSNHRGIIIHTRLMAGEVTSKDRLRFVVAGEEFITAEVGALSPDEKPMEKLSAGEIGYIVTGIKSAGIASVGDTVAKAKTNTKALPGYQEPKPVVWASVFPESQDDFDMLRQALDRLRLSDSSLSYEEEVSGTLGRGFRCGFLGMLHLEIVTERLKRESNLPIIVTTPSITYEVTYRGSGKKETIYSPALFPDHGLTEEILEPWVSAQIITPSEYVSPLMQIFYEHEVMMGDSKNFGDGRVALDIDMPLRELMRGFFDKVKSGTSGYASISYELGDMLPAEVVRLDILVAEEVVPAFSRVVSERTVEEEAKKAVEKLYEVLPKQLFATKIQGKAKGRVISSKTLKAMRKDVTGHLYGGDITRKKKLLEKQKKGKKRMKESGKVHIPQDVFMKMVKE